MQPLPKRLRRLPTCSGFTLKWIAIISMIIDHFGSIVMDGVLAPYRVDGVITFTANMPFFIRNASQIKLVCDALGSIAFPIFCFLLVEGFQHTHNPVRYGVRMGAFALLSEIPFDLAHYGVPFNFALQNVMFTLCVGIFTLLGVRYLDSRKSALRPFIHVALVALTIAAGCALAFLLRGEYVFLGILAIALFYLLRENRYWQLLGLAPLLVVSPWILLALPPILLYNGTRGKGSQYFFYVFYPAHFLLFAGVAALLAQRIP